MPVVPTYPGIYIEEVLSSAHTIIAAPTSLAVFIGYTHPFKTVQFAGDPSILITTPKVLFGFSDFEREFGGFFSNRAFDHSKDFGSVALAVYQFFLNGGAQCYVVGLRPQMGGSLPGPILANTRAAGGVTFKQIELTEDPNDNDTDPVGHVMTIEISNVRLDPTTADVKVTFGAGAGAVVESFRGVSLLPQVNGKANPAYIGTRIGTDLNSGSSTLVKVQLPLPASFSADRQTMPATQTGSLVQFRPGDFGNGLGGAMADNSALDKLAIFNLMNLPGVTDNAALAAAVAFCERKMAFLLIDPLQASPADDSGGSTVPSIEKIMDGGGAPPLEPNAALYFPYLQASDPVTGSAIEIPPCGTVAGIMARIDLNRGVWKAPAGYETTIVNSLGVVPRGQMSNERQGILNGIGVNCLRDFPGVKTVVFGARTLVTNNPSLSHDWRYVPVRRMALFLEQTLLANLGWVVFEPNDEPLWTAIRSSIESFMLGLFRQHAFQGDTPDDAFQVKCDKTTTTQDDIDSGVVNIVVAFAPLRPAEFVIVKITQLAGQARAAT